jgi:hypothetical protein
MYFPSSQATVLVVRPDDADSTIFPKRITLLEMTSQAVISPQRDNSMNPSRMESARELTPNSSPVRFLW